MAMNYIISKVVRVDLRHNGVEYSGEYGPDSKDVPAIVGDHLVSLGLAELVKDAKKIVAKEQTKLEQSEVE